MGTNGGALRFSKHDKYLYEVEGVSPEAHRELTRIRKRKRTEGAPLYHHFSTQLG